MPEDNKKGSLSEQWLLQSAMIQRRICQLTLTRITHQVSRALDLNR